MDDTTPAAHCPNCGAEYRTGFDVCADCGIELVRGPAQAEGQPDENPGEDPWTTANRRWLRAAEQEPTSAPADGEGEEPIVLCSLPEDEAFLLAGLLTDAGVEAQATPASRFVYSHILGGAAGRGIDVLVRKKDLEEAAEIARKYVK